MALTPQQADNLANDIMTDVRSRLAGSMVVDGKLLVNELGSLRDQVRLRLVHTPTAAPTPAPAAARVIEAAPSHLPWWLMMGFALGLLGGLMGFVGAAKSYEVARVQKATAERIDVLRESGSLERVEAAGKALSEQGTLEQMAELQAFKERATQAVRDLAESQATLERLRKFE